MTSAFSLHNLSIWIVQVLIITGVGAFLPAVFRIHHPRSRLIYNRLLLFAALLLPLIQPVQHEVVVIRGLQEPTADSPQSSSGDISLKSSTGPSWRDVIAGILITGIVVRLGWLSGGLWQLRRLRNSATPLYPFPQSVHAARSITKTDALFCVSPTIQGPVTFGFLRPTILLPKTFLEMADEEQHLIACHELTHVRRNDWLMTTVDELIAALLWFQPAVWWIVAQNQLAREQLVDAAVVAATASRESYIQTLFSLAETKWESDVGVASLFLRKRHCFIACTHS